MRLQDRDIKIIELVYDYHLIASNHIQLLTGGAPQNILRRLQKLFHHGYLDRLKLSNNDPILYGLGNRGADLLAELGILERGKIDWTSKNRELKEHFLHHTLMTTNFRAALTLALRERPGLHLSFWIAEDKLKEEVVIEGDGYRKVVAPLIPDGYFGIAAGDQETYFFLESDRSTMTDQRFLKKMKAYWMYWKLGKHKEKQGIPSFRVLTVTRSNARRDNLRNITSQVGGMMFWFACEKDYTVEDPSSILKPIWQTSRDDTLHHLLG